MDNIKDGQERIIDSHCHYNSLLTNNLEDTLIAINNCLWLESAINIGLDPSVSKDITLLSLKYSKLYNSIGIHPLYSGNVTELYDLYNNNENTKIIGIGEMGLDDKNDNMDMQKRLFIEQIELANYLKLPVIIHSSNCNYECLQILKLHKPLYGYVFHCFQPEIDIAKSIIQDEGYISIGGPITYKNARRSIEIVRSIPLDHLLIETDSPYMAPEPLRNTINNSLNIVYIINAIESITNLGTSEIVKITNNNTKRLFKKIK
jgi:TatD DNase family protein